MSNDLTNGLAKIGFTIGDIIGYYDPAFFIGDEQGIELFYNLFLTPWLRVTGDLQWINPHEASRDDIIVAAVRAQIRL